jgi:hypothetical protein
MSSVKAAGVVDMPDSAGTLFDNRAEGPSRFVANTARDSGPHRGDQS